MTDDDVVGPAPGRRRKRRKPSRPPRSSGQQIEWQVQVGAIALLGVAAGITAAFMSYPDQGRVCAVAVGTFVAASLLGAFGGFLFGLPRDAPSVPEDRTGLRFLVNSNLLKVSDFLTTVIVGLSLTQIGRVLPALDRYGDAIRKPLGNHDQSSAVGVALVIVGFVGSAILGYVWTTVRLRERLERSEMELRQVHRSDEVHRMAVDFVLHEERDIDTVRLALASLTRAQARDVLSRLPDLQEPSPGREGRRSDVLSAIDEHLRRRV